MGAIVGCLGDWRRAAAVLFEPESLRRDPAPGGKARESAPPNSGQIAPCLRAEGHDASEDGTGRQPLIVTPDPAYCLRASEGGVPQAHNETLIVAKCLTAHGGRDDAESETLIVDEQQITSKTNRSQPSRQCPTLTAGSRPIAFNARQDPRRQGLHTRGPASDPGVRRLTPRERERLQGFPDDWTLVPYRGGMAKDGPRNKAIGNSMAVPVMRWIGRRIDQTHKLKEPPK